MCTNRLALAALSVAVAGFVSACAERPRDPGEILASACEYLLQSQAEDGGWHSETHGILKSGQAWTPFVLHAMLDEGGDRCAVSEAQLEQALAFIEQRVDSLGRSGLYVPGLLEYPNYATAFSARVLYRHGNDSQRRLAVRMREYLLGEQFGTHRGIRSDHPGFGSWGFGETNLPAGRVGHVDLSHTRRVLEALKETGGIPDSTAAMAEVFVAVAQKRPGGSLPASAYDGGFYYSPVVGAANKGGAAEIDDTTTYISYATATADGLLALHALGFDLDDDRVADALRWMERHPGLERVPGIAPGAASRWEEVMRYYHFAGTAQTGAVFGLSGGWRDEMATLLWTEQRPDGSFSNPQGAPNKEDDPLLATALAVIALHYLE